MTFYLSKSYSPSLSSSHSRSLFQSLFNSLPPLLLHISNSLLPFSENGSEAKPTVAKHSHARGSTNISGNCRQTLKIARPQKGQLLGGIFFWPPDSSRAGANPRAVFGREVYSRHLYVVRWTMPSTSPSRHSTPVPPFFLYPSFSSALL